MTKKVFSTFLKILVLILFYDIGTGGDGCVLKGAGLSRSAFYL